jgi:hypothetical protein
MTNTTSDDVTSRVVSQSASAVSAHDIAVITIVELKLPIARATATMTYDFKLASPDRIIFTRTLRTAVTTLDFTRFITTTAVYGGDQHPASIGEAEAVLPRRDVGGGVVAVPGAR